MRFSVAAVIAFIAYANTQALAAPTPYQMHLEKRDWQEIKPRNMSGLKKLECAFIPGLKSCKIVSTYGHEHYEEDTDWDKINPT
jgi:hypothetical protein